MRRVALLTMALLAFGVPVARGGGGCANYEFTPEGDLICLDGNLGGGGSGGGGGGGGTGSTIPASHLIWWPTVRPGPPPCADWYRRDMGHVVTQQDHDEAERLWWIYLRGNPICPDAEVPAITPGITAESFVRRIELPIPNPTWPPGKTIVGLESFLRPGVTPTKTYGEDIPPFGGLTVRARSIIYVDWGDGTGWDGPYEDAEEIPHVYQYDGTYDITVRQVWVADWTLGGESGTIDTGLETVGTLPGFVVEERQAVIE